MLTRKMTADEKRILSRRISPFSYSFPDLKEIGGMLISIGGTFAFAVVFAWLVLAWVVRLILGVDFGWNHPHGMKIFWALVFLSFAFSAKEILRVTRPNASHSEDLLKDLENGLVEVEEIEITAAKVFQEPEHGGLIYFLRTSDERVYAIFDHESQDLAVDGEDPVSSGFEPRSLLRIERVPTSRQLLAEVFSGGALEIPSPIDLTVHPDMWPESGEFIDIPWSNLEAEYGR